MINAQKVTTRESKDGKYYAENFIAFEGGVDSVIIQNKCHKFKFSYHEPYITIKNEEGYNLIANNIGIRTIKKINKNIYLVIGISKKVSYETEFNLIFIKKGKILKYYVVKSGGRLDGDLSFEYLSKTKEVLIPFSKKYRQQNYGYDIELKNPATFDTIRPLPIKEEKKSHPNVYYYKLKIE